MGVAPDCFLLGARQWKPRHYFHATKRVADAFRLLDAAAESYMISRSERGCCSAQIPIGGVVGEANEASETLAISLAIDRAIGIALARDLGFSRCPDKPVGYVAGILVIASDHV